MADLAIVSLLLWCVRTLHAHMCSVSFYFESFRWEGCASASPSPQWPAPAPRARPASSSSSSTSDRERGGADRYLLTIGREARCSVIGRTHTRGIGLYSQFPPHVTLLDRARYGARPAGHVSPILQNTSLTRARIFLPLHGQRSMATGDAELFRYTLR